MQMVWQRPLRGTDEVAAILMLVDRVLGVQQALDGGDREIDVDPIFGGCVAQASCVDMMVFQPFMDLIEGFIAGLDQLIDLGGGQVFAVGRVGRIGYYDRLSLEGADKRVKCAHAFIKLLLELVKLALL